MLQVAGADAWRIMGRRPSKKERSHVRKARKLGQLFGHARAIRVVKGW